MSNDIAVIGLAVRLSGAATVAVCSRDPADKGTVRTFTDERRGPIAVSTQQLTPVRHGEAGTALEGLAPFDARPRAGELRPATAETVGTLMPDDHPAGAG